MLAWWWHAAGETYGTVTSAYYEQLSESGPSASHPTGCFDVHMRDEWANVCPIHNCPLISS